MINSFCDILRDKIKEDVQSRLDNLETGTGSFERDERVRGEIRGLRLASEMVDELEERARKQDNEEL
jgi:hypothetical protein